MADELTATYWYMRGFLAALFLFIMLVIVFVWIEGETAYYRWQLSLSRERQMRTAQADRPPTDEPSAKADNSTQSQNGPVTAA